MGFARVSRCKSFRRGGTLRLSLPRSIFEEAAIGLGFPLYPPPKKIARTGRAKQRRDAQVARTMGNGGTRVRFDRRGGGSTQGISLLASRIHEETSAMSGGDFPTAGREGRRIRVQPRTPIDTASVDWLGV